MAQFIEVTDGSDEWDGRVLYINVDRIAVITLAQKQPPLTEITIAEDGYVGRYKVKESPALIMLTINEGRHAP